MPRRARGVVLMRWRGCFQRARSRPRSSRRDAKRSRLGFRSRVRLSLQLFSELKHHRTPDAHPGVYEPVAHLRARHAARLSQRLAFVILGVRVIEMGHQPVAKGCARLDCELNLKRPRGISSSSSFIASFSSSLRSSSSSDSACSNSPSASPRGTRSDAAAFRRARALAAATVSSIDARRPAATLETPIAASRKERVVDRARAASLARRARRVSRARAETLLGSKPAHAWSSRERRREGARREGLAAGELRGEMVGVALS